MLFASKELAIMSSSYFSGNLFSKDPAKEWFLFLSWEVASPTVQGRLLIPAENTRSISSLKSKQETNPQIPRHPFLKLERSSCLAKLRSTSHPTAGMLINFTTNELVRTYLPRWRFQGRYSFDAWCHLPQWADRISLKPHALVLLCY